MANAYQIGSGHCEDFAEAVLEQLGHPKGIEAIEYANLTGAGPGGIANEVFDLETLERFAVKVPAGLTVDQVNASGLGTVGTHIFLRWETPTGYVYFDAEAPQGLDSPFSLPFAQRYLKVMTNTPTPPKTRLQWKPGTNGSQEYFTAGVKLEVCRNFGEQHWVIYDLREDTARLVPNPNTSSHQLSFIASDEPDAPLTNYAWDNVEAAIAHAETLLA